ncbi:hypothetical protein ACHAPV_004761 [Trichoderma viride]
MMLVLKSEDGSGEETIIVVGGFGSIKNRKRDGRRIRVDDAVVMMDPDYKRLSYGLEAMKMAIEWVYTPASEGRAQLDLVTIMALEENKSMLQLMDKKFELVGKTGRMLSRSLSYESPSQRYAQGLSTFSLSLGEVALQPSTAGTFIVTISRHFASSSELSEPPSMTGKSPINIYKLVAC